MCFRIKFSANKCWISRYSSIVYLLHYLLHHHNGQFHNVPPIWPIFQKVVIRLSEHGDVIETQTIMFVLPKIF